MKKVYLLENLDCANCAMKMEQAIAKLDGVLTCHVSFLAQKIKLELAEEADLSVLLPAIKAAVKKVDAACRVIA